MTARDKLVVRRICRWGCTNGMFSSIGHHGPRKQYQIFLPVLMCAGDPQSPRTFGEKAGAKSEARLLSREATAAVGLGEAAAKIATVRPLD